MGFSFIPVDVKFFELFEAQAAHNVRAAKVFKDLALNWDVKSPAFDQLRDIEHEADITTHEVIDKLNRTFVTPFDREDIHELTSVLDDVVDLIQSVAHRMQLYHVDHTSEALQNMADILWQSTENVLKAVKAMKGGVDAGENNRRLLDYCIEINRLENAGDHALHNAISKLFAGNPDPLEVIKWKDIYEGLEIAMDKCEDIANTIEGIVVKQG